MHRIRIMIGLALLLSSCGAPERDPARPKVVLPEFTDNNFEQEVLRSKQPVLVDFWATWCGPCLALGPIVEDLAGEYNGKLKVGKLDVDVAPRTADRYDVRSIPRLMLFKDGKVVSMVKGMPAGDAKASLTQWLNDALE